MYKCCIFDLDGTLVNSIYAIQKSVNDTLSYWNMREISVEESRLYVGDGYKKLLERSLIACGDKELTHYEEAVERYMESAPGTYMAVLMDVQMPGMNGYEAAKAIRAQKSSRPDAGEIPIYAMTANAYTEDISAALNAGMNGHIAKPVDTAALYRLLKKSMEETE